MNWKKRNIILKLIKKEVVKMTKKEMKIGGIYQFKNVKYSVKVVCTKFLAGGYVQLENVGYRGLFYRAKPKDLEEVK